MTTQQRTKIIDSIYHVGDNHVYGFFKDHRYLSNFHEHQITFEGLTYDSVEAAYQAQKSVDEEVRNMFVCYSPSTAKNEGRKLNLRPDWEQVKIKIMFKLVYIKFLSNAKLASMLLATGERRLEETNYWNDVFWGCNQQHIGKNFLGSILMDVRYNLKQMQ